MINPIQNMDYDFSPSQFKLKITISSRRLYETVMELSGYQRKGTKRQISVQLNASKMRENATTLPTSYTLQIRLFHVRTTHRTCIRAVHVRSKMREKNPSVMNAFQKQKIPFRSKHK